MSVPFVLLCLSLLGCAAAFLNPGWADLALLFGPMVLASLYLLIRAIILASPEEDSQETAEDSDAPWSPAEASARGRPVWVLIDGSNVMHWKDGTADLATVKEVIDRLKGRGFSLGVVFDANVGYKIGERHMNDGHMARLLGLPEARVLVSPKGTPADPILLQTARDLGARIVSNDRYRDWAEIHPELSVPGYLIRGYYRGGQLALEL